MGILPVGVKWEVTINTHPHKKILADIYIFRYNESHDGSVKQLVFRGTDEHGTSLYEIKEQRTDTLDVKPSMQLPWEVLEPLANALRESGIDGASDSKLVGKIEAQAAHLKDLRDIVLSFIGKREVIGLEEKGSDAKS